MTALAEIEAALAKEHLAVLGGLMLDARDSALGVGLRSLLLIGPDSKGFWAHFTASAEYADARPDPLDRWSYRILSAFAVGFGGRAVFPSDGPPYPPFYEWALRSGSFAASPIGLLVHARDGLMVSLRGALALPSAIDLPAASSIPCAHCSERPCLNACPVQAFENGQYAVERCHNHLDTSAGSDCMERGCAARRACPASATSGRLPAQSAFHMRAFHGTR